MVDDRCSCARSHQPVARTKGVQSVRMSRAFCCVSDQGRSSRHTVGPVEDRSISSGHESRVYQASAAGFYIRQLSARHEAGSNSSAFKWVNPLTIRWRHKPDLRSNANDGHITKLIYLPSG